MNLVWKLLKQHISIPQFTGFFFANLFGMLIVLFGYQFYKDVQPIFNSGDSFLKTEYLIVSKKMAFGGYTNTFTETEISNFSSQSFVDKLGKFTSADYKVDVNIGISGQSVLSSEFFFESVPDSFVGISQKDWQFSATERTVPIILPRAYITMYNFGFAQSHALPKVSEGIMGLMDVDLFLHGNGKNGQLKGKVIGFSSRISTILVPQSFMDWSNKEFSSGKTSQPNRLIVKVKSPVDGQIATFLDDNHYEVDQDKLATEKTTYFLKLIVSVVMVIGLIISVLSFYILMLSIYLLLQKNSDKLENLLLIGYSPGQAARPYQLLTIFLNLAVLCIAVAAVFLLRGYYMDMLYQIFPAMEEASVLPSLLLGILLFVVVSAINMYAVKHRIMMIWRRK